MMTKDRAILAGAWLIIGAVGVFGVWKTATAPQEDGRIVALEKSLAKKIKGPVGTPLPPVPGGSRVIVWVMPPQAAGVTDKAGYLLPEFVPVALARRPVDVHVLPHAAAELKAAADLNGVALSWTTQDVTVELEKHMRRKVEKPAGFVVRRQREDGPIEEVARLDAKARSHTDVTTEPNRTYRYWVALTGVETDLKDPQYPRKDAEKGPAKPVEVRCPTATRVKLVGGDTSRAYLMVEKYNRYKKEWQPRIVPALPGAEVGTSGWVLVDLRFDKFTIVAVLRDENNVERVLSTKD